MKASKTVLVRVLFVVFVTTVSYPVSAQLKADFTASPQAGCAPFIVTFNNTSNGVPDAYFWDLGNGVTSTDVNPTTSYLDPGVYQVTLIAYKGGKSDTVIKSSFIKVSQNPKASFSLSDTTGCFPLKINYTNNSVAGDGTITANAWDFGDGSTVKGVSPVHTYTGAGVFSVTLTVTNSFGCQNTYAVKNAITVTNGIKANFNADATGICHSPANVKFSQAATGTGTFSYQWNFGDGAATATSDTTSHLYSNAGKYKVSLTVLSSTGCKDSISKSISVSFVKSAISATDTACSNRQVQFVNSALPTPASTVWSFGDSTTSNSLSPYKTYLQNGVYTVKAVNTFFAGCTDSATRQVIVVTGPSASFTVLDSASCTAPFTAHFKNTTTGNNNSFIWDFGDGSTARTTDGVHTYTRYGSFTVTLKSINPRGCDTIVSKVKAVVIEPFLIIGVKGFDSARCVPAKVNARLVTNNGVAITKYNWDFGDGTVSTEASPVHTYTTAGVYNVKVSVVTAGGCTTSYSFADSIGSKLHPDFTVTPNNVCASTEVAFNNTTVGKSSFLWWYPGDGDTIYQQPSPMHSYADTGYFSPMLVVEQYGCYDTVIKKNSVHIKGPIARFTALNNCANKLQVGFTNKSIEDYTRRWSFGDGQTDTAKNPVHTYKASGVYLASLFVTNGGCTYTTTIPVKVVSEAPVANVADSVACRNATLQLYITGANANNIDTVRWFTPSGIVTARNKGLNVQVNYQANGSHTVYAVVSDVLACTDTLYAPYNVSVYGPTAKLKAVQTGGCKNGTIAFTDSSTSDGLHPINLWQMDYGDKKTEAYNVQKQPLHTYTDVGNYTAKLKVTDNIGCTDMAFTYLISITQPHAAFTVSDTTVCPGKKVAFTNATQGLIRTYVWDFGDSTYAYFTNVTHLYTAQGSYIPRLYVKDVNGCTDTASVSTGIKVFTPSAKFLLSDSFSACPPLSVDFTNLAKNYASFAWSFGDGNTSTIASPTHVYTYPGVYPAKLVVYGNGGCVDSVSNNITIKGPTGTFAYNKTTACYPVTQTFKATSQNAVQYLWDYSDGSTKLSVADTSSHAYKPGFYLPKLILIDAAGCKVAIKGNDTIRVFSITAGASFDKNVLCDSGKITFKDTSVTNDVIASSKWAFGDNSTGNGSTVIHNYTAAGLYNVSLYTRTMNGCADTVTIPVPVKVVLSPVISIAGDASYCVPAAVTMQANIVRADTSALTWAWNFGNGTTANVQNPGGVLFTTAGNYQVLVTATNSTGCAGIAAKAVSIHALPLVNAGMDTSICRNGFANLHATGATNYVWTNTPGIGGTTGSNTVAKPDSTEIYAVTGTDGFGCKASDSIMVKVTQPVKVAISASDTLCHGESKTLSASGAQTYQWYPAVFLSDAAAAQPVFKAAKDTAIVYQVIGFAENKCFADTASVRVKVYPIPEMQVVQSNVTASSGSSVQLGTVNSPDVTKWKWSPAMWLNNPNIPNPVAQPRESITYTVVAANEGACITRAQVAVTVTCNGANIFVPNTFSPNGDGANDIFYARGTGLYNIKSFRVFNRWGQLIFERLNATANNPADGWNGTINGQPASNDVYVYIIEVLCINNTIIPVKGNITLMR